VGGWCGRWRPVRLPQHALRVGNLDPGGVQRAQHRQVDARAHVALAVVRVGDPVRQGELQAVGGEGRQLHRRCRLGQHPRHLHHGRDQPRHEGVEVAAVGHLHRARHEHAGIGQRRVLDPLRDHHFVGHDGLAAVEGADDGVARADVGDAALEAVDLHDVADAHAALGQDDEATDVVGGQLLQAEADAHAQGAAEHAQRGEVDARGLQREQQADEEQQRAQRVGRHLADAEVVGRALEQLGLEPRRDPQRRHQHHDRGDHALDDVGHRDARGADLPGDVVELLHDQRQQAGDPHRHRHPGDPRQAALEGAHEARVREGAAQHAAGKADGGQRDQDGDHQLEDGDRDVPAQRPARQQRQQQRQQREQQAVDDAVAVPDAGRRIRRRHAAAQQPQHRVGQQQAAGNDADLDQRRRPEQGLTELDELAGRDRVGHRRGSVPHGRPEGTERPHGGQRTQ
jgi:hypothetical protein